MTLIDDTTVTPDHSSDAESEPDTSTHRRSPWRFVKWAAIAVVAGIALMYAAIFVYATVLNDAPDALDSGDLTEALADEAPAADAEVGANTGPAVERPAAAPASEAVAATSADGIWVPTDASEFGYRVDEVLSGVNVTAVGRSNQIAGDLTIEGSAAAIDVTVQVADIRSDNGSRDGQFRGRIMNAEQFPTASFVSTSPIDFGEIPAAGDQVTVSATGDLTLRGVTRSVTFDVTAELASSATGDRIGVLGSIPIEFDDFDIPEPSIGSVSVEDHGLLEFVLVFER